MVHASGANMTEVRGLVVAAPASGSGKTLLTIGLIGALRARGHRVGAAKCGPDYIDPGFLAAAAGRPVGNLDPWAMRAATLRGLVDNMVGNADLVLIEGVMGLFDGPAGGGGATADLAARLALPVLLVVDAARQGQSAGAVAAGFAAFRADVGIIGVVFNRVASARHEALLREGMQLVDLPVLGIVPAHTGLALESRHLGLVQARERRGLAVLADEAARLVADHLDLDRLEALAGSIAGVDAVAKSVTVPPIGQRIAVADDVAFGFAYPHILDGWRRAGAELMRFSPVAGEAPANDCDAIYLPGGYPELHAGTIAANTGFMAGLRACAARGGFVFGECGGYMVLGEGIVDGDGVRHEMAGLLGLETSFAERKLTLGYRNARLVAGTRLGASGWQYRGHEFHYATAISERGDPFVSLTDASGGDLGQAGLADGSVAGSFFHFIDQAGP